MRNSKTISTRARRTSGGRATIFDVCRELGVSTATVSRVVNNQPGVGPALREKILGAIKKMNYAPQAAARQLSRAKSDTLGVVFQDLTAGWPLLILRGMMARTCGTFQVNISLSTRAGDAFELPNKMLAEHRVDGMIWLDPRATEAMIKALKKQAVPFVVLQKQLKDPEISTISMDCRQGGCLAMRHLLSLGHRRILLLTGPPDSEDSRLKMAGVRQAAREFKHKITPDQILVGHHVGTHAISAISEYFQAGRPKPDAIFAFNDAMAIAVLQWLRGQGYRVPGDIALAGFDGIDETEYLGLTTVETPMYEMGVLAVQILLDQIADPTRKARQVLLQGHLHVRGSCGGTGSAADNGPSQS
ncbi:MAG: LacI family DNA-binding transcriptional regulator [Lentisphaerota bacterium]